MPRANSKETILDAAEAVVLESGASRMTLDAVAERSGISKGGLMYNFPTKESLLEGMIDRLAARFAQRREKARKEFASKAVNELMVEIRTIQGMSGSDNRLSAALLAVTANQPELARTMREEMRARFFGKLAANDSFIRSGILFFAALGLHFHELLNLSILDNKKQNQMFEELLRLAGGSAKI